MSRYSGYSKVIISCFFHFFFPFFWGGGRGGGGEGFGVVQGFCLTLKLKLIFFVSCKFIEYMIRNLTCNWKGYNSSEFLSEVVFTDLIVRFPLHC